MVCSVCLAIFTLPFANGVKDVYDYIIVGAGSAGSPLAARLAKAGKSVLLMEAGPDADWTGFGKQPHEDYDGSSVGGMFFSNWCKSRGCSYPDMQYMCGSSADEAGEYPGVFTCCAALVGHIQSTPGWLTLKSLDPKEYPAIFPHYLGAVDDIDRLREAANHFGQDILPIRPDIFNVTNVPPRGTDVFTGGVRAFARTVFHPVGTAKMGPASDSLAVVDSALRVRGVQGLRIADASVIPLIPNVNTDVAIRLVGYHLADIMLQEAKVYV